MATETWPTSLPQRFLQDGYTESNIENLIQTSMTKGPDKRRKRATEAYQTITGSMYIDLNQRATFLTFYKDTLGFGAEPCNFPIPLDESNYTDAYIDSQVLTPIGGGDFKLALTLTVLVS